MKNQNEIISILILGIDKSLCTMSHDMTGRVKGYAAEAISK